MTLETPTRTLASAFVDSPETNLPRELINGVVYDMAAPELDHQNAAGEIFILFKTRAKASGGKAYIAPLDVVLDGENVVQPDVIYLLPGSRCVPDDGKRLIGVPDLIAEVLSPISIRRDRRDKFALYERVGVRELWLVDPRDRLVEVWQHTGARCERFGLFAPEDTFESPLLGTVAVSSIFPTEA